MLAVATPDLQKQLIAQLNIDFDYIDPSCFYQGARLSTLRDVLIAQAERVNLKKGDGIYDTAKALANTITDMVKNFGEHNKTVAIRINTLLAAIFKDNQIPENMRDLPDILLAGERHAVARNRAATGATRQTCQTVSHCLFTR